MRFFSSLFFLSALFALPAFARMNQLVSRTSHDHPAIAHRQHHPKRILADICANVDISVLQKISATKLLQAVASVEVHICICITLVPAFVKTDHRVKDYVDRVGEKKAASTIKDMIREADRRETCYFPQHSTPWVSGRRGCDPCGYECDETFRKRDGKCVCDAPLYECNGKCALVCGSSRPHPPLGQPKKRLESETL